MLDMDHGSLLDLSVGHYSFLDFLTRIYVVEWSEAGLSAICRTSISSPLSLSTLYHIAPLSPHLHTAATRRLDNFRPWTRMKSLMEHLRRIHTWAERQDTENNTPHHGSFSFIIIERTKED